MRISLLLTRLDSSLDGPWVWKDSWNKDMPAYFHGLGNGVYDNVYQDLDDSPVSFHTTEPVDPTQYYNSDVGTVLGDIY